MCACVCVILDHSLVVLDYPADGLSIALSVDNENPYPECGQHQPIAMQSEWNKKGEKKVSASCLSVMDCFSAAIPIYHATLTTPANDSLKPLQIEI